MDSVTIMAYRDEASALYGIIKVVRNGMNLAALYHKKVSIGVETGKSLGADYASLYKEDPVLYDKAISGCAIPLSRLFRL
ncbi:MAG TPA: hypothetical protein VNM45_15530 [Bacillus sp. (in: firmicutes)]|nr:hypothetical protein [Bacillus sp. (in: firmicutes)]